MDAFEEWHHLFKKVQHEINHRVFWIIQTSNISCLLELWIDIKLVEHYPCFDFNSSSHTILGVIKGNQMHYFVICTLHLRREMKPMTNNVMSSSSLNTFNFKHDLWLLMTNHFLFSFVRNYLEDLFTNVVLDQLKNSNPIWSHYDKLEFRDGLLYYNGLFYVLDGPI